MKQKFLPLFILLVSTATQADPSGPVCVTHLEAMREVIEKPVVVAIDHLWNNRWKKLTAEKPDGLIAKTRDWLADLIKKAHKQTYDITAISGDASTVINADTFAKDAAGVLTPKARSIFNGTTEEEEIKFIKERNEGLLADLKKPENTTNTNTVNGISPLNTNPVTEPNLPLTPPEVNQPLVGPNTPPLPDTAPTPEPGTLAAIKAFLQKEGSKAQNFKPNQKKHFDDMVSKAAEKKVVDDQIVAAKKSGRLNSDFHYERPLVITEGDAEGNLSINDYRKWKLATEPAYAANLTDLQKRSDQLGKELNEHVFSFYNPNSDFNNEQMRRLEELEPYYKELNRQLNKMNKSGKNQFPDPDDQKIYETLKSLYETDPKTGDSLGWAATVSPPGFAQNRIQWERLSGGVKSLFMKDVPNLKNKVVNSRLVQYVKQLTEQEKQAILGNHLSKGLSMWKNRPTPTLIAGVVGAVGTTGLVGVPVGFQLLDLAYDRVFHKQLTENDIIESPDGTAETSMRRYFQQKYGPLKMGKVVDHFRKPQPLWDDQNHLINPAAIKELNIILAKRLALQKTGDNNAAREADLKGRLVGWSDADLHPASNNPITSNPYPCMPNYSPVIGGVASGNSGSGILGSPGNQNQGPGIISRPTTHAISGSANTPSTPVVGGGAAIPPTIPVAGGPVTGPSIPVGGTAVNSGSSANSGMLPCSPFYDPTITTPGLNSGSPTGRGNGGNGGNSGSPGGIVTGIGTLPPVTGSGNPFIHANDQTGRAPN